MWCGGGGSVSSALASWCRRSLSTPLSSDFDGSLPSRRVSVSLPPAVSFEVSDGACKVASLVARGVVCALASLLGTLLRSSPFSSWPCLVVSLLGEEFLGIVLHG